jgi:hypothetical protein
MAVRTAAMGFQQAACCPLEVADAIQERAAISQLAKGFALDIPDLSARTR